MPASHGRETATSSMRQRLVDSIAALIGSAELLREQLVSYERAMTKIAKHLENGKPAIAAAKGTGIATPRRGVTEAIEEFEAARHRLRLALFEVGKEEGATISEVGRVLGISRQLASRLAAESQETSS